MSQSGVYLYGFVKPDLVRDFAHPGHEEIGPVRVMEFQDLAAIVSPVPPGAIEAGLASETPDPGWVVPRALHHELVLEAVLARGPVLPVRFGCLFGTDAALEAIIIQHREPITRFLSEFADQEEWALKAFLDDKLSVESLLQRDPKLSERFRRLPTAPGTRYFLEKQLREDARGKLLRSGKAAAERILQAVLETGVGVKSLPLRGAEAGGRQLLLKLALLIPRGEVDRIVGTAERAAAEGVPLVVEQTGPWPPYHFCPSLGDPSR